MFVGGRMSCLYYLCLLACRGVQHLLCFALFFFVLCTVPCVASFSGLSFFSLSIRYSLTFILSTWKYDYLASRTTHIKKNQTSREKKNKRILKLNKRVLKSNTWVLSNQIHYFWSRINEFYKVEYICMTFMKSK